MAYKIFDFDEAERKAENVSFQPNGLIWIPGALYRRNMKGAKFAELFFDEDRNFVGIKTLKDSSKKSLPIKEMMPSREGVNPSYSISAKKFFVRFNIDIAQTRKYKVQWNAAEGLWECDLNSPVEKKKK